MKTRIRAAFLAGVALVLLSPLSARAYAGAVSADPDLPRIEILEPQTGKAIAGKATIRVAFARGKHPIKGIVFIVDETQYGDDMGKFPDRGEEQYDFPTGGLADGIHRLTVRIVDTAGQSTRDHSIVFINNTNQLTLFPPQVRITTLRDNQTVSGMQPVGVRASSDAGVAWMVLYVYHKPAVGNEVRASTEIRNLGPEHNIPRGTQNYQHTFGWDTRTLPNGVYLVQIKAIDFFDRDNMSDRVRVLVNNLSGMTEIRPARPMDPGTPARPESTVVVAPNVRRDTREPIATVHPDERELQSADPRILLAFGNPARPGASTPDGSMRIVMFPPRTTVAGSSAGDVILASGGGSISGVRVVAVRPGISSPTLDIRTGAPRASLDQIVIFGEPTLSDVIGIISPTVRRLAEATPSVPGLDPRKAARAPVLGMASFGEPTLSDVIGIINPTVRRLAEATHSVPGLDPRKAARAPVLGSMATDRMNPASADTLLPTRVELSAPGVSASAPNATSRFSPPNLGAPRLGSFAAGPRATTSNAGLASPKLVGVSIIPVAPEALTRAIASSAKPSRSPILSAQTSPAAPRGAISTASLSTSPATAIAVVPQEPAGSKSARTIGAQMTPSNASSPLRAQTSLPAPRGAISTASLSTSPVTVIAVVPQEPAGSKSARTIGAQMTPSNASSPLRPSGSGGRLNARVEPIPVTMTAPGAVVSGTLPATTAIHQNVSSVRAVGLTTHLKRDGKVNPVSSAEPMGTRKLTKVMEPTKITRAEPYVVHLVRRGENLAEIAHRYRVPTAAIVAANRLTTSRVSAGQSVRVPRHYTTYLNGVEVAADVPGFNANRKVPVAPFRAVMENAGGKVAWKAADRTVSGNTGSKDVRLTIGQREARVNNERVTMDLPAFIFTGRTLVPASFFKQALDATVMVDPENGNITIKTVK